MSRRSRRGTTPPTVLVTHPSAELYGSDRMLLESVRGLRDAGAHVVVALPGEGPLVEAVRDAGAEVRLVDVAVLRKSSLSPRGLVALAREAAASARPGLRLLREVGPDAVYVSTLITPVWPLLARCAGAPVVGHVHEAEPSSPRWVRAVMASPLVLARRVVVNSRFAQDVLLEALPALRRRCTVVLNGVDGPPLAPAVREDLVGAGSERRLRLLYVGRISARKGVLVAVEALQHLLRDGVDAELHLVGSVFREHQEFAEQLHRATAAPDLAGRVVHHGFGSVWPHLERADVVLVPSVLAEPFGNTAVEAALAARPVVASRCGGLPEALQAVSVAHLVEPGDARELATAVQGVVADLVAAHRTALADSVRTGRVFSPARYRAEVAEAVLSVTR